MKFSLADLAKLLNATVHGDAQCEVTQLSTLENAESGSLSFFTNSKYLEQLKTTKASAVIVSPADVAHCSTNALIVDNPYWAYARIAQAFDQTPRADVGIHRSACIGQDCRIDLSASIGPQVVLGDQVILGKRVQIDAGVVIGSNVVIGDDTHVYPNVTIYHGVQIGQRVLLHGGAVIGSDGFGYAPHEGRWAKIPQVGTVIIGDDVEIGANTTVDRGAIDNTVIGDGVKLDNQIQVAHNVEIGAHTAIAACTVIAGSVKIGKHCVIGGASSIAGHLSIADGVILAGATQVIDPITQPGTYASVLGCLEKGPWFRNILNFYKLAELVKRVTRLEKKSE